MKRFPLSISLHGLRAQVLLWIVLPVTLLLIGFSLSGVLSHQNTMRAMAVEENSRLVQAYAQSISLRVENYSLRHGAPPPAIEALELSGVLSTNPQKALSTIALYDADGEILFSLNHEQHTMISSEAIAAALRRETGVVFTDDPDHSHVIAYAPVPDTEWVLMTHEPWHMLTDPLIRFEQVMPVILFSAVTVSLLILFFGLRYVVRPLQELGSRINRSGQGNFQALENPIGGVKEIEDLRSALSDLAKRVQNYQGALHHYLGSITKAQEEERARLARELHDETVQTLIALGHKAQMVQRNFRRDSPETETHINDLRQMIAGAIEEVRRFSRALRPVYLEELGFMAAMDILMREAGVRFTQEGTARRLSPEKEMTLYRVAQEAVNNAQRHAQANEISAHLTYSEDVVRLKVCDDGTGFDVPNTYVAFTQNGHFGVMGMWERALLAKGDLTVESMSGKGTTITLTLPE